MASVIDGSGHINACVSQRPVEIITTFAFPVYDKKLSYRWQTARRV